MSEMTKPNVGADLVRIHKVITRGLDVTAQNSAAFARDGYPDGSTREGFTSHARALVAVVHGHHLTEDDRAFPYFQKLMPDAPFDELAAQHQEMTGILEGMEAAVEAMASEADAGAALMDLNREVKRLSDLWVGHIGVEEFHLSAEKADELLTTDEQIQLAQQFAQHSQEHAGPDFLVVPFLLYNLEPAERAVIESAMPPIVTQQLVPVAWKEQWAPLKPFLLE